MMHRIIRDHLEQVLADAEPAPEHPAGKHLAECEECRDAVAAMREQAAMLRQWRVAIAEMSEVEPRPGFYARVLERIEAQTPSFRLYAVLRLSVWPPARHGCRWPWRCCWVSMWFHRNRSRSRKLPVSMHRRKRRSCPPGFRLILPDVFSDGGFSGDAQTRLVTGAPDQDAVLVNLVTYREQ